MKATVKCEYCQSIVDAGERYCPSCGSPLPAPPPAPAAAQAPQAARRGRAGVLLLLLLALLGAGWVVTALLSAGGGGSQGKLESALAAIQDETADTDAYEVVIASYLEQNRTELAWNYAYLMVEQAPGEETGSWCMETFRTKTAPTRSFQRWLT